MSNSAAQRYVARDAVPSTYGEALQAYQGNMKRGNTAAACIPTRQTDKINVYYSFDIDEPASVELNSQDGKLLYSNRIVQLKRRQVFRASGYNTGVHMQKLEQGNTFEDVPCIANNKQEALLT